MPFTVTDRRARRDIVKFSWVPFHDHSPARVHFMDINVLVSRPAVAGSNTWEINNDSFVETPSEVAGQHDLYHSHIDGEVSVVCKNVRRTNVWTTNDPEFVWHSETYALDDAAINDDVDQVVVYAAVVLGQTTTVAFSATSDHRQVSLTVIEEEVYSTSSGLPLQEPVRKYKLQWRDLGTYQGAEFVIEETVEAEYHHTWQNASDDTTAINWNWYDMPQTSFDKLTERAEDYGDGMLSFGEMALNASDSARLLNINGLAYLKDALGLFKFCGQLSTNAGSLAKNFSKLTTCRDVATALSHGKSALKDAASLYLANHYGTKLTIQDTAEIADAIEDLCPDRRETQRIGDSEAYAYDEYDYPAYRPHTTSVVAFRRKFTADIRCLDWDTAWLQDKMRILKRGLSETDLLPSWSNAWDMVPWSFVIDWFLPIGEGLEHLERIQHQRTLDLVQCFCSTTGQWTVSFAPTSGLEGKLRFRCYKRSCLNLFPTPPIEPRYKGSNLGKHVPEGAALFVQSVL